MGTCTRNAEPRASRVLVAPQMEVVKTRMQLQGELVLRGGGGGGGAGSKHPQQAYQAPYRNAPHAFYKICRDEGFRGIQAGLLPGLMYQVRSTLCIYPAYYCIGR